MTLVGGTIVDGSGRPGYEANVTIRGDTIVAIDRTRVIAGRSVDVVGLVVCPGFIDMHSHSDLAVLSDPDHLAKVGQGVTLEVVGQDGLSYYPATDDSLAHLVDQLTAWNGAPTEIAWRDVGGYLDAIDAGAAVNVACLVPHGSVRLAVMGTARRSATDDDLGAMRRLVAAGMAHGAFGLSTGLTYAPGAYADDDELVGLCRIVAERGGYHGTHHRNYGSGAMRAYEESIGIAKRAKVPLHLAHCHLNFPENAGKAPVLIDLIDRAVNDGLDISLDTYPYLAGATYLASLIPLEAQEGGPSAVLARLRDPSFRAWASNMMENVGSDGHHGMRVDWETIVVSGVARPDLEWTAGLSIAQIAQRRRASCISAFADLLVEDELNTGCIVHVGNEDNVRAMMAHPRHMGGTDGLLVGARPHPRAWGTFPRFLGKYVREEQHLPLEECVRHLTGAPAARLGLRDRGIVEVGRKADLVVFDPATIRDRSTFAHPRRQPRGIAHVMVNGQFTLQGGRRTGRVPGVALRHGGGRDTGPSGARSPAVS
jgi:N-acyl-D-amino-acid deacylase